MGTRGYVVWRYRRIWRVRYNHYDSYPSGLGLVVRKRVPKGDLMKWVQASREWFDKEYKDWLSLPEDQRGHDCFFDTKPPSNDLFIEWIYELDLDNLVFHVDSHPLFRLDCLPDDDDDFIRYISFDNYGLRNYHAETPEEYRYEGILSRKILPVPDEKLEYFATLHSMTSSDDILRSSLSEHPVRTRLNEFLVGLTMVEERHSKYEWEVLSSLDDADEDDVQFAFSLVALCLFPKFTHPPKYFPTQPPKEAIETGRWRVGKNLVIQLVPQLKDEPTMKAAIADVAKSLTLRESESIDCILFGTLTLCLLRFTRKGSMLEVAYGPVAPFLPSHFATTPSTQGIRILTALGQVHSRDIIESFFTRPAADGSSTYLDRLPVELHSSIANHLSINDLLSFASSSETSFEGAMPVFWEDRIENIRLLAAKADGSPPTKALNLDAIETGIERMDCLDSARFESEAGLLTVLPNRRAREKTTQYIPFRPPVHFAYTYSTQ